MHHFCSTDSQQVHFSLEYFITNLLFALRTSAAGFFIYIAHVVIVVPIVRFEDFVLLFSIGT